MDNEDYLQELAAYAQQQVEEDKLDLRIMDAGYLFDIFEAAKLRKLRFLTPHKKHFLEDIKAGFYGPNHIAKCRELIGKLPKLNVSKMYITSRHIHHLRTIINAPDSELWRLNSTLVETLHELIRGRNAMYIYTVDGRRLHKYNNKTKQKQ